MHLSPYTGDERAEIRGKKKKRYLIFKPLQEGRIQSTLERSNDVYSTWKNIIKTQMRRWTWRFRQTGTKTDPFVKSKMCQTLKWAFFKYYFMLSWQWALLSAIQVTKEMLVRSLGQEDPLEEEMATHSSILAWKIPWTERPGGLRSIWSQGVEHDWVTEHILTIYLKKKRFIERVFIYFSIFFITVSIPKIHISLVFMPSFF